MILIKASHIGFKKNKKQKFDGISKIEHDILPFRQLLGSQLLGSHYKDWSTLYYMLGSNDSYIRLDKIFKNIKSSHYHWFALYNPKYNKLFDIHFDNFHSIQRKK